MRILITAGFDANGIVLLRKYGDVRYEYYGNTSHYGGKLRVLTGDSLISALSGVSIFITEVDQVSQDVLANTDTLKLIAVCRGNPVNVCVEEATKRGVLVLNTPGRNAEGVAELTVFLMLILARQVPQAVRALQGQEDKFSKITRILTECKGTELWNKTVGLVGLGAIGRKVAARLKPFEMNLIAYDPYIDPKIPKELGIELVNLDELLIRSDFVSLHASVTPESRGMLGAREFNLMKPTAYFINTARAALIDETALYEALASHEIAGAGLDVFMDEPPPPDYPLLTLDNVVATPHIGGNTHEVATRQSQIVTSDIMRVLRGERPLYAVNPEVLLDFDLTDLQVSEARHEGGRC